jgi:hypothetical protein
MSGNSMITTRSGFQRPPSGILWLPPFCQVTSAVLGDHWPDLCPVLLEFGGICDPVFGDEVSWHLVFSLQKRFSR